jgi:2-oxoisovalerate dehydrogenase E1 component
LHSSIGQEGIPAAILPLLRAGDNIIGNHRSHHHLIVQTLSRTRAAGWNPLTDDFPPLAAKQLARVLSEILGRVEGINHGVAGSMHLRNDKVGFMASTAIVGGGLPIAAGLALAHSVRNNDACTICFIGDGAVNQGTFHETANIAKLLRLPLLIVVENNGYSEATRPTEASALLPLASQGLAHGFVASCVKGSDLAAIYCAAESSILTVRRREGPAIIEVETYRHFDHVGHRQGSATGYRTAAEEAAWFMLDPMSSLPKKLDELGLIRADEVQKIEDMATRFVSYAYQSIPPNPSDSAALDARALLRGPATVGHTLV